MGVRVASLAAQADAARYLHTNEKGYNSGERGQEVPPSRVNSHVYAAFRVLTLMHRERANGVVWQA
jgi:hypothetical protein